MRGFVGGGVWAIDGWEQDDTMQRGFERGSFVWAVVHCDYMCALQKKLFVWFAPELKKGV